MKVGIVGGGYVGLVSAVCFADLGNTVTCIENHQKKYTSLQQGTVPFFEPELEEKFKKNLENTRLTIQPSISSDIFNNDIIILAVGTPMDDDGKADLTYLFGAVNEIIAIAQSESITTAITLTTKSTVPVGTGQKIKAMIANAGFNQVIQIASNPEFLREGSAVYDFFHPDRIIIGCESPDVFQQFKNLYQPVHKDSRPIAHVSLETAELAKYASNTFLATKISFINEMAKLCDAVGADIKQIATLMGQDGRIGKYFLNPSPGYGGSCFPKDTHALQYIGKENNIDLHVVNAAIHANNEQILYCVNQCLSMIDDIANPTVSILGCSFKPNTDDIRESASIKLIDHLLQHNVTVNVVDPEAIENTKHVFGNKINYCSTLYAAAESSDGIVLMTEWNDYRGLDLTRLASVMRTPNFIDFRLIYTQDELEKAGFTAYILGKPVKQNLTIA